MNDIKHKIALLRMFYAADRYAPNPLDRDRLHKIVVEGRDQQFIPLIGFSDHPTWSRHIGKPGSFTEAQLRRIAKFFHLDEIAQEGEEGWQLLTDRMPHQIFAAQLVSKNYGTLASVPSALATPAEHPSRTDFLRSLMSVSADELTIGVVEIAGERGAAEWHELDEQNLLHQLRAWTPYAYEITGDSSLSGDLYVLEISSTIRGDCASCAMVAPSKLHKNAFFTSPTIVPATKHGGGTASFKMSDKDARCTTIAFVTPQPLKDLPEPRPDNFFAKLSIEHVYLLTAQLVEVKTPIFRGMCTLGLRT